MTVYERLIKLGHTPMKAKEIALGVERKEVWALSWWNSIMRGAVK